MILQTLHALAGVTWVAAAAALVWTAARRPAVAGAPVPDEGVLPTVASAALAALLLTGIANLTSLGDGALDGSYSSVLTLKIVLAVGSFAAAAAYLRAPTRTSALLWAVVVTSGAGALLAGLALDRLPGSRG